VEVSEDTQFKTLVNCFELSFTLTEAGLDQYHTVIAAVFKYIELVTSQLTSLHRYNEFPFFWELKRMSELGFKYFKITDSMDNASEIASEMLYTTNVQRILKDVYPDVVVEGDILMADILALLRDMTLEKVKVVLSGQNILSKESY
jgi:secreted Zn-dependent insulinase-like peptidase